MNNYFYSYGFDDFGDFGSGAAVGAAVAGVLVIFLVILLALAVVMYVFQSLGLYTMAKRRGIRCYGLAWVPIGDLWIMGKLADQFDDYKKGKNMHLAMILLIGSAAVFAITFIIEMITLSSALSAAYYNGSNEFGVAAAVLSSVGIIWLVAVALAVFEYIALYKIYYAASPKSATALLVCSIIFGVVMPFALFALRKKDEGFVEASQYPPQNGGPGAQSYGQPDQQPDNSPYQQPVQEIPAAPSPYERLQATDGSNGPSDENSPMDR